MYAYLFENGSLPVEYFNGVFINNIWSGYTPNGLFDGNLADFEVGLKLLSGAGGSSVSGCVSLVSAPTSAPMSALTTAPVSSTSTLAGTYRQQNGFYSAGLAEGCATPAGTVFTTLDAAIQACNNCTGCRAVTGNTTGTAFTLRASASGIAGVGENSWFKPTAPAPRPT